MRSSIRLFIRVNAVQLLKTSFSKTSLFVDLFFPYDIILTHRVIITDEILSEIKRWSTFHTVFLKWLMICLMIQYHTVSQLNNIGTDGYRLWLYSISLLFGLWTNKNIHMYTYQNVTIKKWMHCYCVFITTTSKKWLGKNQSLMKWNGIYVFGCSLDWARVSM